MQKIKWKEMETKGERFRCQCHPVTGYAEFDTLEWWHPVTLRWVVVESQLLRDLFWGEHVTNGEV